MSDEYLRYLATTVGSVHGAQSGMSMNPESPDSGQGPGQEGGTGVSSHACTPRGPPGG